MKTNILKYLCLPILALFILSGCNELEQEPRGQFTEKNYWTSLDRAMIVLNQAYANMHNWERQWRDEALSDNLIEFRGTSDSKVIRNGIANANNNRFKDDWKWCYKGIKLCNMFIENVDLIEDADENVVNRLKSEARVIRAILYLRLTCFWGDVPLFYGNLTLAETLELTKTSRSEIRAELQRELDEAIPYLPKRDNLPEAENGRITKGAAAFLKARIYLYDGDMAGVERWAGNLINDQETYGTYSLFTTSTDNYTAYENLFRSQYEYNSEVILDYSAMEDRLEWSYRDLAAPSVMGFRVTNSAPLQALVDDYITLDGLPVASTRPGAVAPYTTDPSYNEANMYANRDPRMDATVVYHGSTWKDKNSGGDETTQQILIRPGSGTSDVYLSENATETGYYTRKLFDPDHNNSLGMYNNLILMRYADVLLMYAEAVQANNPSNFTEDVWNITIRPIRERAGFTRPAALNFPNVNATAMQEIIRRERRAELALEGLRYFDIMRWGQGKQLLDGPVYGAKMINGGTEFIRVDTRSFTTGRDELWSLPQSEMDLVPGIKPNNPGY